MTIEIYFRNINSHEQAIAAVERGEPIKVRIGWGRYANSVGSVAAQYVLIHNKLTYGRSGRYKTQLRTLYISKSCVIKLPEGKNLRINGSVSYKGLLGLSSRTKLVLREKPPVVHPEFILDRHGQRLQVGSAVLVSMTHDFVFGNVERLTSDWLIIRRGKTRTKLRNMPGLKKALVKFDKGIMDRFMLEKLSKM